MNKRLLNLGAAYNLGFAIFHSLVWKIQNWGEALLVLSRLDQEIMQMLNLCLILVFSGFAWISFAFKNELLSSRLGQAFLYFIAAFWFFRFGLHFYFSSVTMGIILSSSIFLLGFIIYAFLAQKSKWK